jgi:hypothetical protein
MMNCRSCGDRRARGPIDSNEMILRKLTNWVTRQGVGHGITRTGLVKPPWQDSEAMYRRATMSGMHFPHHQPIATWEEDRYRRGRGHG